MATKVNVTGYVAGGIEFSKVDQAMAKVWWNNAHGEDEQITRRVPDSVLIAWFDAGQPEQEIPVSVVTSGHTFGPGERRRYNHWLADNELENNAENKLNWFESGKPAPEGYVDTVVSAKQPTDVLAVIYSYRQTDDGSNTDEVVETNVTRQMLQDYRGKKRGAASTDDIVGAAVEKDALDGLSPFKLVRGDATFNYTDGSWTSSTATKAELKAKYDEQAEELARSEREIARLMELLEKAEKGIDAPSVKKAPTKRASSRAKVSAE